jgi:hypothetical protein
MESSFEQHVAALTLAARNARVCKLGLVQKFRNVEKGSNFFDCFDFMIFP